MNHPEHDGQHQDLGAHQLPRRRTAMLRLWAKLLVGVGAAAFCVWSYDRVMSGFWVGATDLEIEFVVTEDGSGKPIPRARIEVQSERGFPVENGRTREEFVLAADTDGVARKECPNTMCTGEWSGLGFTDTFGVARPHWRLRVSAPGFEPTEWENFPASEGWTTTLRTGPRTSKLVVPISLRKKEKGPS
jgi:hypothetical protein